MKNLFYLGLGILMIVLTSAATTISVMRVAPEKPRAVYANRYQFEEEVVSDIRKYTRAGYVVKSCTGAGSGGWWILIMEKY